MARLPSRFDLSAPQSLRSGRAIAIYDTSAIGRGAAALGGAISDIGADITRQRNTVDLARAEAYKTKGFIDTENEFSNDGDYSTFNKRAPEKTGEVVNKAAELIRDPAMREKWKIGAQTDAVRTNDAIGDKARALGQQAETVAFDDALEVNRRLYVDPNTSDAVKAKAKADIEASIATGEKAGLLTPAEAASRRDQFIRNAEFSRAKLFTENNPKEVIGWQGVDVSGDIIEAMASVESTGNTNAVSGKGAAGLMQVMPETGAEIARELGDTAYPVNGTEAEQQAYLKDPETSVKYGSHYFGKMLKKYGGDKEAALIAYNGGSQRADQWLAAGRDDKAIPKESADYYRKVLSLSGEKPMPFKVEPAQVQSAKSFLQTRTDKDASHIQGMNDTFAVKVARMLQAAPPGIQNDLGIYSGSRTNERQAELWADALKKYGSVAEARKWVAPPEGVEGSKGSEHNHGMAADLSYKGQSLKNAPPEVVSWLHENASRFGLKFPLANENWHVEDDSTRGGRPNVRVAANSPAWFQNLSPEERQSIYTQAEAYAQREDAKNLVQQKAIQSQANDDFRLRIASMDPTLTPQDILIDRRIDNGDKATLLNTYNEKMKDGLAVAQALPLYQAGKLEIDPYAPESKKVVDGIQDKITALVPPEQQQGATDSLIKQTGIVPQSTFNGIRAGLDSTDTAQVVAALQQASRISQINPAALGRRDGGAQIQSKVDDFTYYVNNLNMAPDEAARRVADMNDPDKLRERKALEPAAKEFAKQLQDEDLGAVFDESYLPFNDPQIGFTEGQALGIQAEYQAIAQEQFYKANGNVDLAKNRAKEELKRLYGVTNITGKPVVMKYPPERYWPANTAEEGAVFGIGADPLGYAKTQLYAEFAGRDADFDPDSVQFVTTPATEAMIKRGEMPAYAVMYADKDGQLQTFPGKLWRPDFTNPKRAMENQQQQRVKDAAAEDKFQRERIIPGQNREQTLDNFLDGDPLTGLPYGDQVGGGN